MHSLLNLQGSRLFRLILPVAAMLLWASCKTVQVPVMPPEESSDGLLSPPQRGSSALWEEQIRQAKEDGRPRLLLLDHGDEALALRVNLIRSARKSIRIQTFNWKTDETGRFLFRELLRATKQRGVEVEILIDHMFCEQEPETVAFLSSVDPRFRLKFYNPCFNQLAPDVLTQVAQSAYAFHQRNVRLHNKLFIVDDHLVITGGRNHSNQYFDRSLGLNYKDRDVLAILPDPTPTNQCFLEYWNSPHAADAVALEDVAKLLRSRNFPVLQTKTDFRLNHLFSELAERASDSAHLAENFLARLIPVREARWVFDSPDKAARAPFINARVAAELAELAAGAEKEILIQTPYVVPSVNAIRLFRKLREDHPDLRVLVSTNSLAATDSWPTYAANYKEKRTYLDRLGFEMWEFRPIPEDIPEMMAYDALLRRLPTPDEAAELKPGHSPFQIDDGLPSFLHRHDATCEPQERKDRRNDHLGSPPFLSMHAKSMVVDDEYAFVGSFNFDPRSEDYNTEVGLIVRDPNFALALRRSIERDASPRNSYRIATKKNVPLVSQGNLLLNVLSEALPFLDPWPFRPYSSFNLREGKKPVPPEHPDFHENWEDVGNFPNMGFFARKQIAARLFKATGMILKPLL